MPRKFKRVLRKRYYMKEKQSLSSCTESKCLVVSIPLSILKSNTSNTSDHEKVYSLLVSIPLSYYHIVDSVAKLRDRLLATIKFPQGWVIIPGSSTELVLCYFPQGNEGMPKMSICLKVSETLEWTVMIRHKQTVIPQSYPSENKFTIFKSLKQILELLTVTHQCIGNNEELFIEFCQYRKKELCDKSGSFCSI